MIREALEVALHTAAAAIGRSATEIVRLRRQLTESRGLCDSLSDQLLEVERERDALRAEVDRLRAERDYLAQQKSFSLGTVAGSHDAGCECLACEHVRLRAEVERLTHEHDESRAEVDEALTDAASYLGIMTAVAVFLENPMDDPATVCRAVAEALRKTLTEAGRACPTTKGGAR